jgi:hypothetical protein
VSLSPKFKWLLVVVLLSLTLGWKLVANTYLRSPESQPDEQLAERKVAQFLARNHFNVVGAEQVVFGLQLVSATAGSCRVRVALSSSRGWHRDLLSQLPAQDDRTFVVFGGKIYREQPMWLTVPDFLWSKLLGRLGLNANPTPVINVIESPLCDAEKLPWRELG